MNVHDVTLGLILVIVGLGMAVLLVLATRNPEIADRLYEQNVSNRTRVGLPSKDIDSFRAGIRIGAITCALIFVGVAFLGVLALVKGA